MPVQIDVQAHAMTAACLSCGAVLETGSAQESVVLHAFIVRHRSCTAEGGGPVGRGPLEHLAGLRYPTLPDRGGARTA